MGGFRHTDWLPKFEHKMTTCLCITTSFHSCQRDPITSVTANPLGDRKHSETQNDHSFVATGFISNLFFFFFLATLLYNTNKYTSDSFLRQQPRPPQSAAVPSCRKPAARLRPKEGKLPLSYRSQSTDKNKAPIFLAAGHFPKRHFPASGESDTFPSTARGTSVDLLSPTSSLNFYTHKMQLKNSLSLFPPATKNNKVTNKHCTVFTEEPTCARAIPLS